MTELYVGVDVSQKKIDGAVWLNGQAQNLGKFSNDETGFIELSQAINNIGLDTNQIHLVLEPTGGYELHLVGFAYQKEWLVSLPNPKQVRDWAKGVGYRTKTDPVDARVLSHYGVERQPKPHPELSQEIKTLDSLLKRQLDLQKMRRQERNRLHALKARPDVPDWVLTSVEHILAVFETELNSLEQELKAFFKAHPTLKKELKLLRLVPGIGPKIAPFILVLLHRWHALTNGQGTAKQLTAYVGLDPQHFHSGTSVFKRPSISHMGNGISRSRLFMGSLGGIRGHNPLRDFYQRLVGRGKPKKVALVAGSRKILVWAWTTFSRGIPFDPNIVDPNFA